jgi:hypothetical protein
LKCLHFIGLNTDKTRDFPVMKPRQGAKKLNLFSFSKKRGPISWAVLTALHGIL